MLDDKIPSRIALMVKDIIAYRNRAGMEYRVQSEDIVVKRRYMNVFFHNKGIELINLPKILHNKNVVKTVPSFLDFRDPPTVTLSQFMISYLILSLLLEILISIVEQRV